MKKQKNLSRYLLFFLLALFLALAGCKGDSGNRGPAGPPGPTGPAAPGSNTAEACATCHSSGAIADVSTIHPGLTAPVELSATIDSFTVNPGTAAGSMFATTVFTVTDGNGNPVTGLAVENPNNAGRLEYVRIAYAQLHPDTTAGEPTTFWAGLNRNDRNFTTPPELTDNGDGSYTYVSTVDIGTDSTLTNPYDPTFMTRVLLILEPNGPLVQNALNVTLDVPGTGTAITRDIVTTDACDACHGRLGSPLSGNKFDVPDFHGGDRYLATACVVCHTNELGTATPNGNGEAEFGPMIHRIHDAKTFIDLGDFSDVTYPQDIRNCTTCHQGGTDSDNWKNVPSVTACASCHDITFDNTTPAGFTAHPGGPLPGAANCQACHPAETGGIPFPPAFPDGINVTDVHTVFAEAQSANFQYNIVDATFDDTSRTLSVTYSVTNPANADTPYVLNGASADTPFAQAATGDSRLAVDIAYPPEEVQNAGQDVGQPISIDALANGTDNGDGTYTVTATIPDGVTAVTVAMEGHPAVTDPATSSFARIPVYCPTKDFNLDGTPISTDSGYLRRDVVQMGDMADKCKACHFQLSLHGENRTDNVRLCVLCHNPNATDLERRGGITAADAPDGKTQQAIDFKVLIHGIHDATNITVYGFSGNPTTFADVTFPGILSNCETCHLAGTYTVPLQDVVLDTTTDEGADLADPADNLRTTKTTSVCSSCHTGAVSHMLQNGGHQDLTEEEIQNLK